MFTVSIYLLIAIVFSEGAVFFFRERLYAAQTVIALGAVCVLFASWFLLENPWQVLPERKVATTMLGLWIVAVPIAVLSILSFGFSKLQHAFWRHLGVLLSSAAIVHVYPWFVLFSICASGLDCI